MFLNSLFPKLKIHGYNNGFATNSSSSHSVVIDKNNILKDNYDKSNNFFGWENFILKDKENKLKYLSWQIKHSLDYITENELLINTLVKNLLDIDTVDFNFSYSGVDHNSIWNLPVENIKDISFYRELKEYILRDDVVIVGGNDNEEEDYLRDIGFKDKDFNNSFMFSLCNRKNIRCKKDGDYWIFFDVKRGEKIRFSFNDNVKKYEKSKIPELVDLNITDFCDNGCKFCYKDSTNKGKHANYQDILKIHQALSNMGVFEVALGGGEPTKHPEFNTIITLDSWKDPVTRPIINFSTYSTDWLTDEDIVKNVKRYVGGIGVSIHSVDDIENILKPITEKINGKAYSFYSYLNNDMRNKEYCAITAQHAFGSVPFDDFMNILEKCDEQCIHLLLLGYKTTGRGNSFNIYNYTDEQLKEIFLFIKDSNTIKLSVDTLFANNYKKYLDELEIPDYRYCVNEGKFSCYIDAVSKTMSPSSFDVTIKDKLNIKENYDYYYDYKELVNNILENYAKY